MSGDDVFAQLAATIRHVLGDDLLVLDLHMKAEDLPGFDSFRQVEVLLEVERKFGGRLRSQVVDRLRTLGDYVTAIEQMIKR